MWAAADRNVWDSSTASLERRSPEKDLGGIKADLVDDDLWQKFHALETEMIITKTGRRMFPSLQLRVTGLEPNTLYFVLMDMEHVGEARMKYSGASWSCAGRSEEFLPTASRLFIHPDSPATGERWMSEPVSLQRAKLTNNVTQTGGNIVLTSMHRYQPRVHFIKTTSFQALSSSPTATFVFPQTRFIAVTAYQNEQITKLKIDNNPFAKGFRLKRKADESDSTSDATSRPNSEDPSPDNSVDYPQRPVKRPLSVQSSSSSWTDDSGFSSLSSASSHMEDSSVTEVRPYSRFQWEFNMALMAAWSSVRYLPFEMTDVHRLQRMWRYPYLMPTPPLAVLPNMQPLSPYAYRYPFVPNPYSYSAELPAAKQESYQPSIDFNFHQN